MDPVAPRRRSTDLVVRAQGDETLVLDTRSDTTHCLPAEVARVWEACVAGRTVADVALLAGVSTGEAALAVAQLVEKDLLELPVGLDRRHFLARSAAVVGGSALAFTAIQSVVAPQAALAKSKKVTFINVACEAGGTHNEKYQVRLDGFADGSYTVTVSYGGHSDPTFTVMVTGGTGTSTLQTTRFNVASATTATAAVTGETVTGTTTFGPC